ncbi:aminoacyl-tRNA deacylase [Patescibacteria group bacterium]
MKGFFKFGKLPNMAIPQKIIKHLNIKKIKYEILEHKTAYTAYDKAATLKIKPGMVVKTLILKTDKDLILVLIQGNKNLDIGKTKKVVNDWKKKQGLKTVKKIDFISETVIKNKFKGVKIGVIPPFGDLWKLPVFTDRGLVNLQRAIISAGVHESSVRLNGNDLKKINPGTILGNFSKAKK